MIINNFYKQAPNKGRLLLANLTPVFAKTIFPPTQVIGYAISCWRFPTSIL